MEKYNCQTNGKPDSYHGISAILAYRRPITHTIEKLSHGPETRP